MIGSAVGAVKAAIYEGLRTALGDSAAVLYDEWIDPDLGISATDEMVSVFWSPLCEADMAPAFLGNPGVFDETIRLRLVVQVLDQMQDGGDPDAAARGRRVDKRLDEAVGLVVNWFSDQTNVPDTAGDDGEVTVFNAVLSGTSSRAALPFATGGRGVRVELPVEVTARTRRAT